MSKKEIEAKVEEVVVVAVVEKGSGRKSDGGQMEREEEEREREREKEGKGRRR